MPQQTRWDTYANILMLVHPEDFNPSTNETAIGNTGRIGIEAMDYNEAEEVLYAIDFSQLGTIDLSTGVFTPRPQPIGAGYGSLGYKTFDDCDGMSFRHSDGRLFASVRKGANDLLIQVDHVTGAHISGAFSGDDYIVIEEVPDTNDDDIDDIAFDTADDTLYAIANEKGLHDHLITIDPVDGSIQEIAELSCPSLGLDHVQDMEGIGFGCEGNMWGVTGEYIFPEMKNRLWEIDKTTGYACNPRFLAAGSDYESVTCGNFPIPPTPAPAPAHSSLADGDYDGDGTSDVAIFRGTTGFWSVRGVTHLYLGASSDLPVPGDYSGDGRTEAAIFRASTGLWAISSLTRVTLGQSGDIPVPADYDGDGRDDIAIFRPGNGLWSVQGMDQSYFGYWGDIPVPGDYNGDGRAEAAVFRPATGFWSARNSIKVYLGMAGDLPMPGDYNGAGFWTPAISRPSSMLWAARNLTRFYFGNSGDLPVPADYLGNGVDHPAIFRPSSAYWSARDLTTLYFGAMGDVPVTR